MFQLRLFRFHNFRIAYYHDFRFNDKFNEKFLKSIRLLDPDNMIGYYFCSPIISGIILSIFSVIGVLLIDSNLPISTPNPLLKGIISMNRVYISSFWLMLTVYFIYSSIRSTFINIEILKILHDSKTGDNNEKISKNIDEICEMLSEK